MLRGVIRATAGPGSTGRRLAAAVFGAAVLLAALPASAGAQPTVDLKIARDEVFAGEAVQLLVEVQNFQTCEPPTPPNLDGATLREQPGTSESSYTSIVNGRVTQTRTRTYTFELIATVPGELLIPPFSVRADGQTLKTTPLRLAVRPSDADRLFAVEVSAGRQRVYVGQRVPLTLTIWVKPARYGSQVLDADEMFRRLQAVNLGSFPQPQFRQVTRRPRPDGDPQELYYAYELGASFVAQRPGRLTFDDLELGIAYPMRGGTRHLRARPTGEGLEVLPVPAEGRPADYAGAVGLLAIEVVARPTEVRVGDPIEVTLDILGDGPLETLPPPLLSSNARLDAGFRLPSEQLAGETQEGRRRYKFTLRAKRDDVTEIPPIEYPYFDPDAERFVIARSKPVPLTVRPVAEVTPPDMSGLTRLPAPSPGALEALDGLHDIETSENALLARGSTVSSRMILAAAGGPGVLVLLVWGGRTAVARRSADPLRRRRQQAHRTARRRLAETRTAPPHELGSRIVAALTGYLADRLGEPPGRFTGPGALTDLRGRGVPERIVAQWAAVIQRCEEVSFGGATAADGDALRAAAAACVQALERRRL